MPFFLTFPPQYPHAGPFQIKCRPGGCFICHFIHFEGVEGWGRGESGHLLDVRILAAIVDSFAVARVGGRGGGSGGGGGGEVLVVSGLTLTNPRALFF